MKITIYSNHGCMQCKMSKKVLDGLNLEYNEINISEQPEAVEYLQGLNIRSVPYIEVVKEDGSTLSIKGFEPGELKALA